MVNPSSVITTSTARRSLEHSVRRTYLQQQLVYKTRSIRHFIEHPFDNVVDSNWLRMLSSQNTQNVVLLRGQIVRLQKTSLTTRKPACCVKQVNSYSLIRIFKLCLFDVGFNRHGTCVIFDTANIQCIYIICQYI